MLNTNTLNHICIQKVHSENWSGLVVEPSVTSDCRIKFKSGRI